MKRMVLLAGLLLVATVGAAAQRRGGPAEGPPLANSEAEKKALAVLDEAQRAGETYANVPTSDGRMLRLLAESTGAKHVVEVGTSTGLSGLWFCLALLKTGGKLTTFEYDPGRAAMAKTHFRKAGVDQLVTIVEGDAHQTILRLKEPIDLVFLDADKGGETDYLHKLLPLVRPGGLILVHNVDMTAEYNRAVTSNPALDTVFYMQGGGLGITLKKR